MGPSGRLDVAASPPPQSVAWHLRAQGDSAPANQYFKIAAACLLRLDVSSCFRDACSQAEIRGPARHRRHRARQCDRFGGQQGRFQLRRFILFVFAYSLRGCALFCVASSICGCTLTMCGRLLRTIQKVCVPRWLTRSDSPNFFERPKDRWVSDAPPSVSCGWPGLKHTSTQLIGEAANLSLCAFT